MPTFLARRRVRRVHVVQKFGLGQRLLRSPSTIPPRKCCVPASEQRPLLLACTQTQTGFVSPPLHSMHLRSSMLAVSLAACASTSSFKSTCSWQSARNRCKIALPALHRGPWLHAGQCTGTVRDLSSQWRLLYPPSLRAKVHALRLLDVVVTSSVPMYHGTVFVNTAGKLTSHTGPTWREWSRPESRTSWRRQGNGHDSTHGHVYDRHGTVFDDVL